MKRIILNSIIIIATSIVLVILVFFTDGVQSLFDLIVRTNYYWLFVAWMGNVMFWVFGAVTMGFLKRGIIGSKNDPGQNFKTVMVGQFFASITPFATGGQPAQVYMMRRMGVDGGTGSSIVILKSVLLQSVLVAYCTVLYITNRFFLIDFIPKFNTLFFIGITASILLLGLYGLFMFKSNAADKAVHIFLKILHFFKITKNPDEKFNEIKESLERFKEGFRILAKRKIYLFLAYIAQFAQLTSLFFVPVFMMRALEGMFMFTNELFVCTAMVVMIAAMVPTPGTTGGAEGLSLLFISPFFYNSPKMSVILIWRILTYYSNIIFGGIFCLFVKEKPLKPAEEEEELVEV